MWFVPYHVFSSPPHLEQLTIVRHLDLIARTSCPAFCAKISQICDLPSLSALALSSRLSRVSGAALPGSKPPIHGQAKQTPTVAIIASSDRHAAVLMKSPS